MPPVPKPVVVKNPKYLAYIRTLPCWVRQRYPLHVCADTMGNGRSEVSHLRGKSDDGCVMPLCGAAHRTAPYAWHNGARSFCKYFGVWKDELIAQAERHYAEWRQGCRTDG